MPRGKTGFGTPSKRILKDDQRELSEKVPCLRSRFTNQEKPEKVITTSVERNLSFNYHLGGGISLGKHRERSRIIFGRAEPIKKEEVTSSNTRIMLGVERS